MQKYYNSMVDLEKGETLQFICRWFKTYEDFSDKIIGSWLTQTDSKDEQFDITDADSVNAIHTAIDNAVETIKLTITMEKAAE